MRWLTNFYDLRFKWTAKAGIRIHPTKTWLPQLINFKNAIWTWRHSKRTICKKNNVLNLEKIPQKHMEYFRLLFHHLAWIEHQFLSGRRDSSKAGSLWGNDERCESSKEVSRPELIGQRFKLRVRVTMFRFWGSSWRDSVGRGQHSSNRVSGIYTKTIHQSTTPSLSRTIWPRWASRQPPYNPDLGLCDFSLFPKLWGCRYETIEEMKEAVTKVTDTLTQEDFHGAFQKGTTSALQPEEITSKGTRVSCVYYQ